MCIYLEHKLYRSVTRNDEKIRDVTFWYLLTYNSAERQDRDLIFFK